MSPIRSVSSTTCLTRFAPSRCPQNAEARRDIPGYLYALENRPAGSAIWRASDIVRARVKLRPPKSRATEAAALMVTGRLLELRDCCPKLEYRWFSSR
jgi:hypothetical protein